MRQQLLTSNCPVAEDKAEEEDEVEEEGWETVRQQLLTSNCPVEEDKVEEEGREGLWQQMLTRKYLVAAANKDPLCVPGNLKRHP